MFSRDRYKKLCKQLLPLHKVVFIVGTNTSMVGTIKLCCGVIPDGIPYEQHLDTLYGCGTLPEASCLTRVIGDVNEEFSRYD